MHCRIFSSFPGLYSASQFTPLPEMPSILSLWRILECILNLFFYLNVSLQFGLSSVPRPTPFVCLLATFQKCGSFGILFILRIFANPPTPGNNFNVVLCGEDEKDRN